LAQLTRGERMVEILKQNQYVPMDVAKQIVIIFSAANSYLDDVDADKISDFEKGLFDYLDANNSTELDSITTEGKISEDVEEKLNEAITSFKGGFTA
jgi:F-type H+-transporting ATPase subunit alpha